jgi:hypothetical protein
MKMDYDSKRILVRDAIHNLRNRDRDWRDGMTNCFVCRAWCENVVNKVNVQGEMMLLPEVICESCHDNLRHEIADLEDKIETTGSPY